MDKKKVKKILARTGAGLGALVLGLVPAYLVTPSRINIIDLGSGSSLDPEDPIETTHFSEFIGKYGSVLNEGLEGLHAEFDNFQLSFTTPGEGVRAANNIKIDGDLDLVMRSITDLDLSLVTTINYNGRHVPLNIGYVNNTVYFRLLNFGIKSSSTGTDELLETLADYMRLPAADGGLGFDVDYVMETLTDKLSGLLDISSLISGMMSKPDDGTGTTLQTTETALSNGGWDFGLSITKTVREVVTPATDTQEEVTELVTKDPIVIHIITDSVYNITRVDLGTISLGDFTISGALDIEMGPLTVYELDNDDEHNPHYDSTFEYVEVVNYKNWIKRLANLFSDNGKKVGLDLTVDLTKDNKSNSEDQIGLVTGSLVADFSKLIDLSSLQVGHENLTDTHSIIKTNSGIESSNETLNTVLNGINLGLELHLIGQDRVTDYANLSVKYVDSNGYVALNENTADDSAVMRAKVETSTINWMINEMPDIIKDMIKGDDNEQGAQKAEGLFSAITDSTLVTAIKSGDFAPIIDVISRLENDNNRIYLDLDLSSIGLGDNATISITLDASEDTNKVLDITGTDIELGSLNIDLNIASKVGETITVSNTDKYDSLSFLPGVLEQVSGIVQAEQAGFDLGVTVLDNQGLGLDIYGEGQFNYGAKKHGFGQLTIDQYKYSSNTIWYSHKIALDVYNNSSVASENNARFIYGDVNNDNDNIKGRFTIQTIKDIVGLVKDLIADEDPRFTKFTDMLSSAFAAGGVVDAVKGGDYFRVAKNDLLTEVKQYQEGGEHYLKIVVNGAPLSLDTNIDLRINFATADNGSKSIKSIELKDLVIGETGSEKHINLVASIKDYDEDKVTPCDPTKSYYDLSEIKTLLEFGINTTKLGYYHLTASVALKASIFSAIDLTIDVKILVDGAHVKLYGKMDVPVLSSTLQENTVFSIWGALSDTRSITTEFTFQTYDENDPHRENSVGGYFTIKKFIENRIASDKTFWYRATSKAFIDGDNLLYYILGDMIDLKYSLVDSFGSLGGSDDEEKDPGQYTKMFSPAESGDEIDYGYSYDSTNKIWDIGINLGALVGNDVLKGLGLKIYGQEIGGKGYLAKATFKLNIVPLKFIGLKISGTINLVDVDPTATTWDATTNSAFNSIVNKTGWSEAQLVDPRAHL